MFCFDLFTWLFAENMRFVWSVGTCRTDEGSHQRGQLPGRRRHGKATDNSITDTLYLYLKKLFILYCVIAAL